MNAALVLDRFDPNGGGLERWTLGFAEFLSRRGHCVHVIAFEDDASARTQGSRDHPLSTETQLCFRLHLLKPTRGLRARAHRVQAYLAGLAMDVVFDTGTSWSGDVFLPCTGSRQWSQRQLVSTHPPLLRLRAALSPRSRLLDWGLGRLEREQVRRARQVIAVSNNVRDLLVRQHKLAPERLVVIPNGVDTSRFGHERLAALRPEARRALGVAQATTLFLGSAFNLILKGMDTAIQAIGALLRERADAALVIAGGEPDAAWRALAAGASDRVRFLGRVEDMVPLFAAADVLVHPTRWDACSLSTIEAAAAGLPVITTCRNGAAELIRDGVTGFVLLDPEDATGLTHTMRCLLDPALRARIGAAAREAARQHDWRANYQAVEAVLLANSRAHTRCAAAP